MRFKECRKNKHTDDTSYVWHSVSRESGIEPESSRYKEVNTRYKKFVPQSIVLLMCLLVGLGLTYYLPSSGTVESPTAPQPEILAVENMMPLEAQLISWEGFTMEALGFTVSEQGLTLYYAAENGSDQTIACGDPRVEIDGHPLQTIMYLELAPGEAAANSLWIETEPLRAEGIREIQDVKIHFELVHAADFIILAQPDPVAIWLNLELP
jgi:hypothetical protein